MHHHTPMDRGAGAAAMAPLGLGAAVALLAGVGGCLLLPGLPPRWLLWVLLALGLSGWAWPWRARALAVAITGVAWAGLQAGAVLAAQVPPALEKQDLRIRGQVVGLPDVQARRTTFEFLADQCPGGERPGCGRRLRLSWYDDFGATAPGPRLRLHAGARLQLGVRLRAPRGLANPGGFDSERYALAGRLAGTGYVRPAAAAQALGPASGVDAWREAMSARIARHAPARQQRFIAALALGDTHGLDDADWGTLRAAGLTHLIAISGFHVGLVAGFVALLAGGLWRLWPSLGRRLPRPSACALAACAGAAGYAALAGFALPTVRTVLMIAVVALARCGRRPLAAAPALALGLLAVLAVDPLGPLTAGFWLSFGGVAWLLWCLPGGEGGSQVRQFLSAQVVATLGLLPLTAALFGQASLAGPLANLLAIPWWSLVVVPLALAGTALEALHAGLGAWAWWLAGQAFAPSWAIFSWLARAPLALWWLPEPRWFATPLALGGAFWLLLPRGLPGKPLAALLWLPLLWPQTGRPGPGEVRLTVLDVGQGLSVLVRTRSHALLYDAGPAVEQGFDAGERVVVPALHALATPRLARVVISHGDADHAGGLGAVRAGLEVAQTLAPAGTPLAFDHPCQAGQHWRWDGVAFSVLHPPPGFPYLRNESSCVLRIEGAYGSVLLTGDIGTVIERRLLREAPPALLRADVVLVAHHGSEQSSGPDFVAATGARLALVSSGHGNRFGHPRAAILRRWQAAGAEVLDTAGSGALTVWLDRGGLAVQERRSAHRRLWDAARLHRVAGLSYRPPENGPRAPED